MHQGLLYQLTSLADGGFHTVAFMYVRFRYLGKISCVCGFLSYFCAVLRFSDPLYAPLYLTFALGEFSPHCQVNSGFK